MNGVEIAKFALKLLEIAPVIAHAAVSVEQARQQVGRYTGMLRAMIDENRPPSPEDWAVLNGEIADLEKRLNSPT